jgi:hypothetical protein
MFSTIVTHEALARYDLKEKRTLLSAVRKSVESVTLAAGA